jgi:hypothetical protein
MDKPTRVWFVGSLANIMETWSPLFLWRWDAYAWQKTLEPQWQKKARVFTATVLLASAEESD